MSQDPSDRITKRKACDICKRRKVRCTGEEPCPNCVRHGVECSYSLSHGRLAHSERRVTRLQDRLRMVEAAWRRFVPDIELSVAVHAIENDETIAISETSPPLHQQITREQALTPDTSTAYAGSLEKQHTNRDLQHDAEQEDVDTLDWDESVDLTSTADGIGSLSMNSKGIGYMGPQSGNALLRNIQSISVLYLTPIEDLALCQSPSNSIPEDVLNSASFSNQCVDWYFQYYNCAYPMLHEAYFRAQLMGKTTSTSKPEEALKHLSNLIPGAIPKPRDGSWPVLVNTVLAIGAHSSNLCNQNADLHFYRVASQHLSWDMLHRGTLSIVQALALLANYLQKRNRPNSGFTLLGVAMNMAQGIGLHRELCGPTISAFTMEIRRRVWWTLFIFDSGARVTFGRPTLSLGGITTNLPQNLDDRDLAVDLDELPVSRNAPTVASSLIWQVKLAKIGNIANEKLLEKQPPDTLTMLELGEQVVMWSASLPVYMRNNFANPEYHVFDVPRMVLLWRSMHLRIVIHRAFLVNTVKLRQALDFSSTDTPTSRCLRAAEECILSILDFLSKAESLHGSLVWYACYWLVTAVFVHVTCLLYEPQNASALVWRQRIEDSKAAFDIMGNLEPTAYRAARVLEKIMDLVPSSPSSTFFALNEPQRMEVADFWNQSWADMIVPQHPSPTTARRSF